MVKNFTRRVYQVRDKDELLGEFYSIKDIAKFLDLTSSVVCKIIKPELYRFPLSKTHKYKDIKITLDLDVRDPNRYK